MMDITKKIDKILNEKVNRNTFLKRIDQAIKYLDDIDELVVDYDNQMIEQGSSGIPSNLLGKVGNGIIRLTQDLDRLKREI